MVNFLLVSPSYHAKGGPPSGLKTPWRNFQSHIAALTCGEGGLAPRRSEKAGMPAKWISFWLCKSQVPVARPMKPSVAFLCQPVSAGVNRVWCFYVFRKPLPDILNSMGFYVQPLGRGFPTKIYSQKVAPGLEVHGAHNLEVKQAIPNKPYGDSKYFVAREKQKNS